MSIPLRALATMRHLRARKVGKLMERIDELQKEVDVLKEQLEGLIAEIDETRAYWIEKYGHLIDD